MSAKDLSHGAGRPRKRSVLVVGQTRLVIDEMVPMLRKAGFEAAGFLRVDDALSALGRNGYDLMVIAPGFEPEEKERIVAEATRIKPEQRIYELTTSLTGVIEKIRAALAA